MAAKNTRRRQRKELPRLPDVDNIVAGYMEKLYAKTPGTEIVPGVAVAVRWNDKIVHVNCYGYANLEMGTRITPDTVFDLGSLSKQFTAAVAYNLVIHNMLDLNEPLSKFFEEFPSWADAITVANLIHHTSALPEYVDVFVKLRPAEKDWYMNALIKPDDWYPTMPNRRKREISNKDVVRWLAKRKRLPTPDQEYSYSNSGYVVLAELIERVVKKPFAKYAMEAVVFGINQDLESTYVFDGDYGFAPDDPEALKHAKCYNRVRDRYIPVGYTPLNFVTGDGNVHSSIRDMATWEKFLHTLDYSVRARELLWSPVVTSDRRKVNYGAGWRLMREKHEETVEIRGKPVKKTHEYRAEYHRGEWLGWRSFIARASRRLVPETGKNPDPKTVESLGIIVLSNADFGDKQFTTCRIAQEISKLFLGRWKKDNIMTRFNCG